MKKFKNVLIVNNLYCLLFFLLIKRDEIEDTFFIFDDDIPDDMVGRFKHKTKILTPLSQIGKAWLVLKLRFYAATKFRFVRYAHIYGQDNLLITSPLIGASKMSVIEDGLANYLPYTNKRKFKLFKRFLGGPLMSKETLGYSDCVDKIYMTELAPIPESLKNKAIVVNLHDMWEKCTKSQENRILSLFNLDKDTVEQFQSISSVLLTQPLSEDKALSEEEKVNLYSGIIKNAKIAIKPHPRELTNYKKIFPNAIVLKPYLPIELITLIGVKFSDVYTVFSTAALGMPGNPRIHFLGTKVHPALVKKWGDIRFENGKLITI